MQQFKQQFQSLITTVRPFFRWAGRFQLAVLALFALAVYFDPAFAGTKLGDVAKNMEDQMGPIASMIVAFFNLLGIGVSGSAILMAIFQDSRQKDWKMIGMMFVGGAILVAFLQWMKIGPTSFLGSDAEQATSEFNLDS